MSSILEETEGERIPTKKYRSREEIIEAYLSALENKSVSKTELMRTAKSYQNQYEIYFPKMIAAGFISYDEGRRLCHLLPNGKKWLELRRATRNLAGDAFST